MVNLMLQVGPTRGGDMVKYHLRWRLPQFVCALSSHHAMITKIILFAASGCQNFVLEELFSFFLIYYPAFGKEHFHLTNDKYIVGN